MNAVDKQHIIDEIRRTATANGGKPLGRARFLAETGIKEIDWRGKDWARWADALIEAGFSPLRLNPALDEAEVFDQLINLTRKLGHFPTQAEMRLGRRANPSFPSDGAVGRLGTKTDLISRLIEFCGTHAEYQDVHPVLAASATSQTVKSAEGTETSGGEGFVYVIRSVRFYKIGRTNALGRREYELAIQLPDKAVTVHSIKTDDPVGIEEYWHKRFEEKRRNGEWFELTRADVLVFKRRIFM
jgi:hypothetical protein